MSPDVHLNITIQAYMHSSLRLSVCGAAGGYTLRNVARCWCFETSRCLGLDLPDQLPDSVSQLPEQLPGSASYLLDQLPDCVSQLLPESMLALGLLHWSDICIECVGYVTLNGNFFYACCTARPACTAQQSTAQHSPTQQQLPVCCLLHCSQSIVFRINNLVSNFRQSVNTTGAFS